VLFSILYLILRGMLRVPSAEGGRDREVEILVLRHQIKVLSRKAGRPKLRRLDASSCRRRSGYSRASPGHRSWSHPRRSFAGTGSWSSASGRIAASEWDARLCPRRCGS